MRSRWTLLFSTFVAGLVGCGEETAGDAGIGGSARNDGGTTGVGGEAPGGELEACGWEGDDPGGLAATGAAVGDIIANVSGLIDQCGETRSLWEFAGGYRIVVLAEGW